MCVRGWEGGWGCCLCCTVCVCVCVCDCMNASVCMYFLQKMGGCVHMHVCGNDSEYVIGVCVGGGVRYV